MLSNTSSFGKLSTTTPASGVAGRRSGSVPASGVDVPVLVVEPAVAAHVQAPNVPACPQTWAPVLPVEHVQTALAPGTHWGAAG